MLKKKTKERLEALKTPKNSKKKNASRPQKKNRKKSFVVFAFTARCVCKRGLNNNNITD